MSDILVTSSIGCRRLAESAGKAGHKIIAASDPQKPTSSCFPFLSPEDPTTLLAAEHKKEVYSSMVHEGIFKGKFEFIEGKNAQDLVDFVDRLNVTYNDYPEGIYAAFAKKGIHPFAKHGDKPSIPEKDFLVLLAALKKIIRPFSEKGSQGSCNGSKDDELEAVPRKIFQAISSRHRFY